MQSAVISATTEGSTEKTGMKRRALTGKGSGKCMSKAFVLCLIACFFLAFLLTVWAEETVVVEGAAEMPDTIVFLSEEEQAANRRAIYEYLTQELGLNRAAACGIIANVEVESVLDPNAWGDYGTSYGICQWHNKRYDRLLDFAAEREIDPALLQTQLEFMRWELEGYYDYVYAYLCRLPDTRRGAYSAGYYWCYWYQRPKYREKSADLRGERARNVCWYEIEQIID